MALAADTNWRWDPAAGNNANGGGYASSLGGARITSPVAFTDIVIGSAGNETKGTSALRPFVAGDVGNVLNITGGTGFTVQRAQITAVDGSNVATFDRSLGTAGSTGGTGNLGGALAVFTDAILELSVPGNVHEVWATATMTLTEGISVAAQGATTAPIEVRGCSSSGVANPTGTDRPLIAAGAWGLFGSNSNYWNFFNLRLTMTADDGLSIGGQAMMVNCSSYNSSTTASREAMKVAGNHGGCINCDAQSDYGQGIVVGGYCDVLYCYVHDCNQGAGTREGIRASTKGQIIFCIIDTCTVGVNITNVLGSTLIHNTFYACGKDVIGSTANTGRAYNNIFCGLHYTDLVIGSAGNETKCTSAAQPFTGAHVGASLKITGGTGFTVQTVTISSVAGGVATCDATLGTAGSTGGVGDCGTGVAWTTAEPISIWDWNNFYNLGTDRVLVVAGPNDFDANPNFTDAPNGDFSRTGNPADGIAMTLGVG